MSWTPPESFEEKLKRVLIPSDLYIRNLVRREFRKGEREIAILPFLADPNRLSLDIGANKGVYTHTLLPLSKGVHAFEPNPKLFRIMKSWANQKATLHPIALGNENSHGELMIPRTQNGYSNQGAFLSPAKIKGGDYDIVQVETRRIDDLQLDPIGFMKIDVEGFEFEVLKGAEQTLARDKPNLLIETKEAHTKRPLEECIGEICAYGYRCYVLRHNMLMDFDRLDLDKHHRSIEKHEDYVFNFIFIPRGGSTGQLGVAP